MDLKDLAGKYSKYFSWDEHDRIYVVRIPELPGCASHGSTYQEAWKNVEEAIEAYLEVLVDKGLPIPQPGAGNEEQKFVVRFDLPTHQLIRMLAQEVGVSMNEYIVRTLRNGGVYLSGTKLKEAKARSVEHKPSKTRSDQRIKSSSKVMPRKQHSKSTQKKAR